MVLLGGDFNVPLNLTVDISSGATTLSYQALRQFKLQLQNLSLHDTWRTMFPKGKDYTFYSPPHQKYSRIDIFFLTQTELSLVTRASIESMFLSDHHPIMVTVTFPESTHTTKSWRLNPSLVKDPVTLQQIRSRIQLYFTKNPAQDITPITVWEAHKCVIRGELVSLATKAKNTQQEQIKSLIDKIKRLEIFHKQSASKAALQDLTHMRITLLDELGENARRRYILREKVFYEHRNKNVRLLERTIQMAKSLSTINHIRDKQRNAFLQK